MTQAPPVPLSYDSRPLRRFSGWRHTAALAIDAVIFAPIVLMLCVGGSFDTEASHHGFSWLFVVAPLVYPLAEIILTRTPGVWLLGGRLQTPTGVGATLGQMLKRALWKWGPLLICEPLYILIGESMGERVIGIVLALLIVVVFLASYLFLLSRSLTRWHVMWFDELAGTRLVRKRL